MDAIDDCGKTAVMMATSNEQAKLLMEAGANIDVVDKRVQHSLDLRRLDRIVGGCLLDDEAEQGSQRPGLCDVPSQLLPFHVQPERDGDDIMRK